MKALSHAPKSLISNCHEKTGDQRFPDQVKLSLAQYLLGGVTRHDTSKHPHLLQSDIRAFHRSALDCAPSLVGRSYKQCSSFTCEQDAAPNSGPAVSLANLDAGKGPPSVS